MGNSIGIPYSGYIPGGINVGSYVVISGIPHPGFNSFSINLCAGPTWDSDTALTFNPRYNDKRVVRNHKQGGSWGLEETKGGIPVQRGQYFEFHMKVEHQCYKITIDKKHFCNFHHRIPKERVQYLYIQGDVTITNIQYSGQGQVGYPTGNIAPPPYPGLPAPSYPAYPIGASSPGLSYPDHSPQPSGPFYNPPVPFVAPIQGGMHVGRIIYIAGIPNHHNPSRFTISLNCGPHADIVDSGLHFDPRFKFGNDHNVVIRTNLQGGKWGPEERHQNYFPFSPGVNFEIMILADPSCYKIAVNNQHFTEFYYRLQPFTRVNYLSIVGDVRLTQVRFQ